MPRRPYEPKGKMLTSPLLASMRETAYGARSYFATKEVLENAERMRPDDELLTAAKAKRLRKQAKRAAGK